MTGLLGLTTRSIIHSGVVEVYGILYYLTYYVDCLCCRSMEASQRRILQLSWKQQKRKLVKTERKIWTQYSSLMRLTRLMPLVSSKRSCVTEECMGNPFLRTSSSLLPAIHIESKASGIYLSEGSTLVFSVSGTQKI